MTDKETKKLTVMRVSASDKPKRRNVYNRLGIHMFPCPKLC